MRIRIQSLASRLSIYTLVIVVTLFLISFGIYSGFTRNIIKEEAVTKSSYQVENLVKTIDAVLATVEVSVENTVLYVEENLDDPEKFTSILYNNIDKNSAVVGGCVAFEPHFYPSYGDYAMFYTFRDKEGNYSSELIGDAETYDYHTMSWYRIPKLLERSYWSEPYIDHGAGCIPMTTYTALLHDKSGKFVGVLTADVSLDWITKLVSEVKPYPNSYSFMLSRRGFYMYHTVESKMLTETFFETTAPYNNPDIYDIGKHMLGMMQGYKPFYHLEQERYAFFAPIKRTGWSVGIVSSRNDILSKMHEASREFWIIVSIGLFLIFLLVILSIKRALRPLSVFTSTASRIAKGDFEVPLPRIRTHDEMRDLSESFVNMQESLKMHIKELQASTQERERIESELHIATQIQMGMLPTIFPPYPNLPEVDLFAKLIPAKEVGGDLYDFFTVEDTLYFTVGDASGKGVPASLLMAVTSSLFRSVALHLRNPADILNNMNNAIAEKNDANMFITLFIGAVDLKTGNMTYSSAGHNAPVLLRNGVAEYIEITPNLPLGIMPNMTFASHEMTITTEDYFFLYSDGLTEAENAAKDLYSDERLLEVIMGINPDVDSKEFIAKVHDSVHEFVLDNEQSDDLTMLVFKLKK